MKKDLLHILIIVLAAHLTSFGRNITSYDGTAGLSNGYVVSFAQDGDGYVWVATEDGLNRFDGKRFKTFNRFNSGLSGNEFNSIEFSPGYPDSLWIATQRDGLCVYDRTTGLIKKSQNNKLRSPDITAIVPASDKGLLLAHYHFGIQYYDPSTSIVRNYDYSTIPGLPRGAWTVADAKNHNSIYVGHTRNGFSVVDTVAKTFVNFDRRNGLPGESVYAILVEDNGNVWLGTDAGAALYSPATSSIVPFVHDESNPGSIGAGRIRSIMRLDNGEIWFATSQGGVSILDTNLYAYSDISNASFTSIPSAGKAGGTSSADIRSLFQDSFGNIWIGNYRSGIDMIGHIDPIFSRIDYQYESTNRMTYKPVWSCTSSSDGSLWFGGDNEFVRVKDGKCTAYPVPVSNSKGRPVIRAIAMSENGQLWIGTDYRGVLIFDETGHFSEVKTSFSDVRTFLEYDNGEMLIGTASGIYISDGEKTTRLDSINDKLKDQVIQDMAYDSKGNLWVGTFGKGVAVFGPDLKLLANLDVSNGFPSNAINSIRCDSGGRMWIATRNGIVMFPTPENVSDFSTLVPLDSIGITHVKSIEEDKAHNIWLSTNKGLVRIDGENLKVSLYSDSNELASVSFMENASLVDDSGRIYFASSNGVFCINPATVGKEKPVIPVKVTDVIVYTHDNEGNEIKESVIPSDGNVCLTYDSNTFTINFNILDPSVSQYVDLAYRLNGLGDVWIEANGDATAMYRNIPPGDYEFQVKQKQKGFDWSSPVTVVKIHIAPPIWLTWWAKTIYFLLGVVFLAVVAWYYKRRVSLKQQLETERVNSRNRQELNEERLRFYTNITHELRTPLTLIMGPLEDLVGDPSLPARYSYKLQTIRDSSTTLLNLINDILDFRKTETQNRQLIVKRGDISNLLLEIGLRYKELNRNPDRTFILDIERGGPMLYYDAGMLTTILNNLLSNAMKYTVAGSITLSYHTVTADGIRKSVIKVSDTGYGISRKNLEHIFERYYQENGEHQASGTGIGLALVKSLADIHNADIKVESEPGKGSTFTLTLLTDNIYPDAIHTPETELKAAQKNLPEPEDTGDEPKSERRIKLLVVEDNDDIREYIRQALVDEFDVLVARNGIEGLKVVHDEDVDMVISDIMMPEMDGISMCRSIKGDLLTSHIPVILLTAKDSILDREEGYESGADSYLTKPFSARLLRSRIYSILRIRRKIAAQFMAKDTPHNNDGDRQHDSGSVGNTDSAVEKAISPIDRQFMEKIRQIVFDNMTVEELGVSFIADKMCMSNSSLYRKINALVGVSPNEYIRHVRLSLATSLLEEGVLSVTEIAERTGFGSLSSFAKAFKKVYGMTATDYVASLKK